MAELSNYLENELYDHVFRALDAPSIATVYVALYTTDPTDADTGAEVATGAYARQSAAFTAPSDGAGDNSADVTFPTATASWGLITHVGLRDAVTGGNLLMHSPLAVSKQVDTDDTFKFNTGDLDVSLA